MKTLLLFLLNFFILSYCNLFSQSYGWFSQSSGTGNNLNDVYFASNSTGIVVGQSGTILRTTNAGTNWNTVNSGTSVHLFSVYFINANTGWVAGDVGVILKTTNGGLTWSVQSTGVGYQLRSISFINSSVGFAAGWYGTFLRTTNGGTSWNSYPTGLTTNLTCINFLDANFGLAGGQFGKLIRSTNGGVNWQIISSGTSAQIEQVNFTASNQAVIIGEGGFIRKSTNMGNNWFSQSSGTGNWLYGTSVKNANFYYLVGDYGTVRKTSNGGTNWYSQTSNTSSLLTAVSFVDTNTGWAVGINGKIIKTTTGGWVLPGTASLNAPANGQTCFSVTGMLDWSDVFPPLCNYRINIATDQNFSNIIYNVAGINASQYTMPPGILQYNTQYYWRVKASNQVGESLNWSSVRNFRTAVPDVAVPNLLLPANNSNVSATPLLKWDSIVTAVHYRCRIATDTGFTNLILDSNNITLSRLNVPAGRLNPNTRYYWKVSSANSCYTSAYSVRWSFVTAMTGLNEITEEIPLSFQLYNNYPNPFNPVTNISFDIPKTSYVNLKIYNVLGELVFTPVNGLLEAGKFSFTWNAENFSSGLYIYRIEAKALNGDVFTKTLKMVLVK
ncbi:MAG: T9SS type A sorting domain-containing protein [Ignavibacteria bacterium]|nr:T9SS type A sorting domain-containing protein [Ignavibacteria bacterium]